MASPWAMALLGQTGSQTSQLTQSSLIFSDIGSATAFPGCAGAAAARLHGRRSPGVHAWHHLLVSTNTYSTPAGLTAALTRSLSAGLPMNSTRTFFIESAGTPSNAAITMSAIFADAGDA